ncbi:MAG TPA: heavy metal translocating P-type ATPase [Rhabdochlamydiaceae bacterium]|nr:heavy metal translocating P-type ATPase [Rhabdochlamydiaceae bacterium]
MKTKIGQFLKHYPIPIFAFLGLLTGIIVRFAFHQVEISQWIWYATLIIGGLPIVYRTFKGMLKGQFASDIVAMLAIITAIVMDQAFAGAVVVLMQSGGEALENYGFRRATSSLEALIARAPRFAIRKIDSRIEKIEIKEIRIGDTVIVRNGDLVPVDGTILQGSAEVDESALTGEPLAKNRTVGDKVFSGTIVVDGSFEIRADKLSKESQYAKIIELVRKAQAEKSPIQRLADRYALFFTPLTLVMAGLGYLITKDPTTILAVLVVATPCPLILATPLAVICSINRAADLGIIVKGGTPMEQVGLTRAAVFDKTGTITFGTPYLEKIMPLNDVNEDEVLYKAALLEQFSSHSVAKAIVDKALEKFPSLPIPTGTQEKPGKGIKGDYQNEHLVIGSWAFLEEEIGKISLPDQKKKMLDHLYQQEKLLIFIAINGKCIGCLVLSDHIRPGIPSMIQKLYSLGVKEVFMLTGDSKKNAEVIAHLAGIKKVEAELLPQQKVATLQKLKKTYDPIVMVGDGINDAPALATATVGIAMGASGSAISAETADIVLLVDDPTKVADAVAAGQRMLRIAKQSIYIGIGLSFVLMVIAAFGEIPPAVGALLQEIIDVAVILNALRAR